MDGRHYLDLARTCQLTFVTVRSSA